MTYLLEEWKPVVGFEGIYEVSRRGGIRRGTKRLKVQYNHAGYPKVTLHAHGVTRRLFVHIVVALAFIGPRPFQFEVNHKDANRANPSVSNLEYVTRAENRAQTVRLGNVANQKLSVDDILEMRRLSSEMGCRRLGKRFGVRFQTVRKILLGERWNHVA